MLSQEDVAYCLNRLREHHGCNFTDLAHRKQVVQAAKSDSVLKHVKLQLRTAHGSLLDPRYTIEGRHIPDRGFNNDYRHYTPKLYCLDHERPGRW